MQQYDLFNPPSYHNTPNLTGPKLIEKESRAKSQEEKILEFFRRNRQPYTPFQVQSKLMPQAPITSIRRAITNLTKRGCLKKTAHQVEELYGTVNYLWVYWDSK
jgi:hypothetical protein